MRRGDLMERSSGKLVDPEAALAIAEVDQRQERCWSGAS